MQRRMLVVQHQQLLLIPMSKNKETYWYRMQLDHTRGRLAVRLATIDRMHRFLFARLQAINIYAEAHHQVGIAEHDLGIYYDDWIRASDLELERIRIVGIYIAKEADSRPLGEAR
jgi:hypothetical protein